MHNIHSKMWTVIVCTNDVRCVITTAAKVSAHLFTSMVFDFGLRDLLQQTPAIIHKRTQTIINFICLIKKETAKKKAFSSTTNLMNPLKEAKNRPSLNAHSSVTILVATCYSHATWEATYPIKEASKTLLNSTLPNLFSYVAKLKFQALCLIRLP